MIYVQTDHSFFSLFCVLFDVVHFGDNLRELELLADRLIDRPTDRLNAGNLQREKRKEKNFVSETYGQGLDRVLLSSLRIVPDFFF